MFIKIQPIYIQTLARIVIYFFILFFFLARSPFAALYNTYDLRVTRFACDVIDNNISVSMFSLDGNV